MNKEKIYKEESFDKGVILPGDSSELPDDFFNVVVFIDNFSYSLIRNPNEERMNNLPLNSDGLTFLNKFESEWDKVSINGGCMSKNIIPECSLGENNFLLMKCLSNVKMVLDSSLANLESSLSLEFKGIFFISKSCSFNNSVILMGIFSSEISLSLSEENIFFFLNKFRSIIQNRQDSFFAKLWKIILSNFIDSDSCSEQFQNLPDHYPSVLKNKFSFADFTICNYVIINLSFHSVDDVNEYLNFMVDMMNAESLRDDPAGPSLYDSRDIVVINSDSRDNSYLQLLESLLINFKLNSKEGKVKNE